MFATENMFGEENSDENMKYLVVITLEIRQFIRKCFHSQICLYSSARNNRETFLMREFISFRQKTHRIERLNCKVTDDDNSLFQVDLKLNRLVRILNVESHF